MIRCVLLVPFFALTAATAGAGELSEAGRYAFHPVASGVLRLDRESGDVAFCKAEAAAVVCSGLTASAESGRPAGAGEVAAGLTVRIAALEARIAALEAQIGTLQSQPGAGDLADEEALDRVMVLTDRMMRRFFGLVRDWKHDMESDEL